MEEDMDMMCDRDRKDFITYAKEAIGLVPLQIKLKKLDERAVIPSYAHDGDVGMDLTAIDVEYDSEKDLYIYHTGIALETDKHYGVLLFPRSSNRKTDAYLCNHVGIADTAIYRGEIIFCYKNRTSLEVRAMMEKMRYFFSSMEMSNPITVNGCCVDFSGFKNAMLASSSNMDWVYEQPMAYAPYQVGDRIGQMVVIPYPNIKINVVKELSYTERGDGAFGSTGS